MNLADVKTFDQLLHWLSSNLDWPVDEIDIARETAFDDLTYEYEAKELGLKQNDIAHIREIRQLRPLVTNQPWGIFFVNFEDKQIPVGVLKRILGGLTLKKRRAANKAEQKAWTLHDLLFISASGNSGTRELSFLHFAEENGGKNKTVLKELGWDHQDTQLKLDYVERTLKSKLVWPDDTSDPDAWREQWAGAFTSTHGATIRTAKALTRQLAGLASAIRKAAGDVLAFENRNGPLTRIYENFKLTIFHNLTPADFADMYAQTICYGLLAASISRRSGALVADDAALMAPLTQPFLKDMMETFLAVGGRKSAIDFNELGVNEVVELLQAADMDAVLLDFGNRNPNEDPVLHFYEHFLKDYDSIMREQRGVYYTPLPVVRFIVRSVHEILQKEFGLADGLADITTWGEMIAKHPEMQLPEGVEPSAHFVQILDPATGTGTFLVEVIEQIEKHLKTKWKKAGKSEAEVLRLWNGYVPAHLLPRLNGFELMMAPYAIAHIKLGMKLHETGYRPPLPLGEGRGEGKKASEGIPRVRVYLTNTLEEPTGFSGQSTMSFITESLALEAKGADEIKAKTPITVVVGNPPYSNFGKLNGGAWIKSALADYKVGLNEQKLNLDDDYIKFVRWMQLAIEKSIQGVVGIITNHTHIDGLTHRRMRESLKKTFSSAYNFELNGSIKKRTSQHDLHKDENVFDIQQGVSISLFVKGGTSNFVNYFSLLGTRKEKYSFLQKHNISSVSWLNAECKSPRFYFMPFTGLNESEWDDMTSLKSVLSLNASGIKTHLDPVYVDFSAELVIKNTNAFLNQSATKKPVKDTVRSSKERKANLLNAAIGSDRGKISTNIFSYQYRAFDHRSVIYIPDAIEAGDHRWHVMQHFVAGSIGFVSTRQTSKGIFNHILTASGLIDMCYLSTATKECGYCFPLFLYHQNHGQLEVSPNLDAGFASRMAAAVGLAYESGIKVKQVALPLAEFQPAAPKQAAMPLPDPNMGRGDLAKNFGPRDVFDYIYAVLHSPTYRTRYADFLKSGFPRIPLPGNADLFRELVALGKQLVALHLLDEKQAKPLTAPETRYIGKGDARVEKSYPKYENGKVMINAACWFEDVPPEVWNFHIGGYQVCQKWLKDRASKSGKNPSPGRVLSDADILHYRRVTIALRETIRLMAEVDVVIEAHGGWPDAFMA